MLNTFLMRIANLFLWVIKINKISFNKASKKVIQLKKVAIHNKSLLIIQVMQKYLRGLLMLRL
jgi:hypothetical protein